MAPWVVKAGGGCDKSSGLDLGQAREVGAQDVAVDAHAHALADARHAR